MAVPSEAAGVKLPESPPDKGEIRLEDGYVPQPFDVICKRDRESISHAGNNRFRLSVEMRVERYMAAQTRNEKTRIIKEIIEAVHGSGGRFIRQEDSDAKKVGPTSSDEYRKSDGSNEDKKATTKKVGPIYYEIGNKKAADKVGHAMRLAMSTREKNNRRKSWPSSIPQQRGSQAEKSASTMHGLWRRGTH